MQGTAFSALGRHREAVSAFEEAELHLEADAGGRNLLYGMLGTSYIELRDDGRAEKAFEELVRISPGSVYGRRMLQEIRSRRRGRD